MITNLQIRNYRRHRKLDIKLDRITVLRGESGRGKTSAMGALRLVAFNQPSGTSFITWDKKQTAVRIVVDNHKITRRRSLTDNRYVVDKKILKAFGTGVPKSVLDIFKLSPLNFHRQHDGPFWFGATAGEVSRQLNKIVNLDVIDKTSSNLESQKREITGRIKDVEKRIKDAKETEENLSFVPNMNTELKKLERKEQELKQTALKSRRIHDLIRGATEHLNTVKNAGNRIVGASTIMKEGGSYTEVRVSRDRLVVLLRRAGRIQDVATRPVPDISPAIKLEKKWKRISSDLNLLSRYINEAESQKEQAKEWERKEKALRKEFKQKMGKVCPLCERQLMK